jgi:putative NIF3 family GTP cyclohydrolase 1 type 2
MEIDEFREMLEQFYEHKAHVALGGRARVRTAALVSGGAYKLIPDAVSEEVDCFITGNFDEPAWHMAHEGGINFFAMGHSATERIGPKALGEHIAKKFPITHSFLDLPNPF